MTRYQHQANKTHGRPCGDDSREPCGWCLQERVDTLSRLLDAANVRLQAQDEKLSAMRDQHRRPSW